MTKLSREVIARLEELLTMPVPEAYLRFLGEELPPALATLKYAGLDDRVADHELYDTPEALLGANEMVREDPVWGEGDEDEGMWQTERLVIGMDISGDVIFVDASDIERGVFRYLVSSGRVIPVRPSLGAYAASLVSEDPTLPRT